MCSKSNPPWKCTNSVFFVPVMQQSAAEKDRGRSGKIRKHFFMIYKKFCVVRKVSRCERRKIQTQFCWKSCCMPFIVIYPAATSKRWEKTPLLWFEFNLIIWIYFVVVWFNLELHWDGDKGPGEGDKTWDSCTTFNQMLPRPNSMDWKWNYYLTHLRFKL